MERFKQFSLNDCCNERVMNSCALCSSRNVVRCIRRCENLVDNVDDTVACSYVGKRYVCVVNHDSSGHCEGKRLTVDCVSRHTIAHVRSWNFSRNNMVKENIGEGCFTFWCVESSQVDSSVNEGLIGWGEDCEWARALQGFE